MKLTLFMYAVIILDRQMTFKFCKQLLILLIVLQVSAFNSGQALAKDKLSQDQVTAAYLYRLSEKIQWPATGRQTFSIHLVGASSELSATLKSLTRSKPLHGMDVTISRSDKADTPAVVDVLYLSKKKVSLASKILTSVSGKPSLVITHGYKNERSLMIDLYQNSKNQIRFNINKSNIINQGLSIDPDIIVLGGNEIDVARIYRATQNSLKGMEQKLAQLEGQNSSLEQQIKQSQKVVSDLETMITQQKRVIITSEAEIDATKKKITEQNNILAHQLTTIGNQQAQIDLDSQSLQVFKGQIKQQKDLIQTQQQQYELLVAEGLEQEQLLKKRFDELNVQADEISRREQILDQLEQQIGLLDTKIQRQEQQITAQQLSLTSQSKQIEKQVLSLYLMAAVLLLIILLALFIYMSRRRYQDLSEQLKVAKDAADYASKSKSAFLANMSHELRTPLNSVLGFSELLLKRSNDNAEVKEVLNIINRSGDHLLHLINDVLDLSKIEAGKIAVEIAPFDLVGLVDDLFELMEERARANGIVMHLELAKDLPRYVKSDASKIRQILMNYISNAIKHTKQGSVTIALSCDDKFLTLRVTDTGIGIAEDRLDDVFEPFVQLGVVEDQPGTGLGLAITSQFAALLGGQVQVESVLGQGSSFSATVEYSLSGSDELVDSSSGSDELDVIGLSPAQKSIKVLIVDDQPDNMRLLKNVIDVLGLEVQKARNGMQAIEVFQAWQPDFIWMDRRMPEMGGEQATSAIRKLPGGDKVIIAALTASAFTEDKKAIVAAGMDDFVAKPYRASQIYSCMQKHLNLEYIYADEAVEISSQNDLVSADELLERLSVLDMELLKQMHNAVLLLDADAMEPILTKIESIDPQLVDQLSSLISNFNYHYILNALEHLLEAQGVGERDLV
ncbi:YfiR/HmsC family protein [Amphritea balenae]|uniref:histidine kinase n=1 Tax=Amphritea balenae TaxID=452629 RepID=A0A3P1STU8_9GAMM|nr:YfiR/HmsC family protein [Amphritea balenae]RRD00629.1 DUF4154 domain-containing protein [Amphritea balenae]